MRRPLRQCAPRTPHTRGQRGNGLMDAMLAMVIFAFVGAPLLQTMVGATRIRARTMGLASATLAAGNEVQRIRHQAATTRFECADTSYTTFVTGTALVVHRTVLDTTLQANPFARGHNREFIISVFRPGAPRDTLAAFRLLQGRY